MVCTLQLQRCDNLRNSVACTGSAGRTLNNNYARVQLDRNFEHVTATTSTWFLVGWPGHRMRGNRVPMHCLACNIMPACDWSYVVEARTTETPIKDGHRSLDNADTAENTVIRFRSGVDTTSTTAQGLVRLGDHDDAAVPATAAATTAAAAFSSACAKSSFSSPTSSTPTDSRTSPSEMPNCSRTANGTDACVMIAGDSARLSTAPRLSAHVNRRSDSRNVRAATSPPFTYSVIMPECPEHCLSASACCGWEGRPGYSTFSTAT